MTTDAFPDHVRVPMQEATAVSLEPAAAPTASVGAPPTVAPAAAPVPRFAAPAVIARHATIRVLCVDDEPALLRLMSRLLQSVAHEVVTSDDPLQALTLFEAHPFDLIITDIRMPQLDGHAFVQRIRALDPEVPIVVVTGQGTVDNALETLRGGATGIVLKPFTAEELRREVERALARSQAIADALHYRFVAPILDGVTLALSAAIEARDLETADHCRSLGAYGERVALALGLDAETRTTVRIGGFLHDVGKIGIADRILLKPGRLTAEEMAEMRRHSEIGAQILEIHGSLAGIAAIVRHHHERWDGGGYPGALRGTDIPIGARIITVGDAFSAMITDRVYRKALPLEQAWGELSTQAGRQFDPEIVEVFRQVVAFDGSIIDP